MQLAFSQSLLPALSFVVLLTAGSPAANAQGDRSTATPSHTEADVAFVQGMIHHHAQALVMTELLPGRTENPSLHLLAERIKVSQRDEIGFMQRWLAQRDEDVPEPPVALQDWLGQHEHGMMMPGMLTDQELRRLADAAETTFDRLFLEFMIAHHEGALVMVRDLFGSPGAGQESWLFQFASDVDADQRAEIARMRAFLSDIQQRERP
jgi:uncharacterized protein (DUF305 family)